MSIDYQPIAEDLARWLQTRAGVSAVRPPLLSPKRAARRMPLPLPSFLTPASPAFELTFTYKGEARTFRYFVEAADDPATISQTLRVHTNGELMVRVPDQYGRVVPNDIYYGNRSTSAPAMGNIAPRR